MVRFRRRLTCQTSPTRQTSTRCVVGFLKSGFNGFNWCAFWKSTSQQVNELLRGRIFEYSKIRVFEDSIFFDGGWGGGEKSRKEAGWGASFLLEDLFEVIFFFFSLKWFPLF